MGGKSDTRQAKNNSGDEEQMCSVIFNYSRCCKYAPAWSCWILSPRQVSAHSSRLILNTQGA